MPLPMITSDACEMNPTKRNSMEDVHRIQLNWSAKSKALSPLTSHTIPTPNSPSDTSNFDSISYFGVYDGHGGRGIVDFIEKRLEQSLATELNKVFSANDNSNSTVSDAAILSSIEKAFLLTDMASANSGIRTSGSTVVSVLLIRYRSATSPNLVTNKIYAANAGDARAILGWRKQRGVDVDIDIDVKVTAEQQQQQQQQQQQIEQSQGSDDDYSVTRLTNDHKATDQSEINRISKAGGFCLRGRVCGVLAVSRALGDHGMKEFVVARPFLSSSTVTTADDIENAPGPNLTKREFLVVACDGLWDVMTDEEVGSFVVGRRCDSEVISRRLIDEALRRGSSDNISVVVVFF